MEIIKDWSGNDKSVYMSLGASSHSKEERQQHDFYATEPKALELLLELENFSANILEPCCGEGHLSKVLIKNGYQVTSFDLIDRGYGEVRDFLQEIDNPISFFDGDVITNPPYKFCDLFIKKALDIVPKGRRVIMFMAIQYVEGKKRRDFLHSNPIKTIWVSSSRLNCIKGGGELLQGSGARCYAWFIWEKGWAGPTEIKWFN